MPAATTVCRLSPSEDLWLRALLSFPNQQLGQAVRPGGAGGCRLARIGEGGRGAALAACTARSCLVLPVHGHRHQTTMFRNTLRDASRSPSARHVVLPTWYRARPRAKPEPKPQPPAPVPRHTKTATFSEDLMVWELEVDSQVDHEEGSAPTNRYEYIAQVDAERRAAIQAELNTLQEVTTVGQDTPARDHLKDEDWDQKIGDDSPFPEHLGAMLTVEHFDRVVNAWVARQQRRPAPPLHTAVHSPPPSPSDIWHPWEPDKSDYSGVSSSPRSSPEVDAQDADSSSDATSNKYEEIALEDAERRHIAEVGGNLHDAGSCWTIVVPKPGSTSARPSTPTSRTTPNQITPPPLDDPDLHFADFDKIFGARNLK